MPNNYAGDIQKWLWLCKARIFQEMLTQPQWADNLQWDDFDIKVEDTRQWQRAR